MNNLHRAYSILGLEPGSSMEAINRRYKRLIMVWHPDRFHNKEGKAAAGEELKKINCAKDLLKKHFESGFHNKSGPCACGSESSRRAGYSQRTAGGAGPDAGRSKSTGQQKKEEDAARQRDDERRRRANDEAKQAAEQAAQKAHEETVQTAFREEDDRKQESLRWKISIGCAAIFALLLCVSAVCDAVEKPILFGQKTFYGPKDCTDENQQLSDEWRSYQNDKAHVAYTLLRREPVSGETSQWRPPFVSNQRTAYWISRLAYHQLVARVEEERNRRAQDLSNTRLDVERYENYIRFSRGKLADAAAKLADPTISARDRQFAMSDQATQLKFLQESQMNLKYAQQHLGLVSK